MTFQELNIIPPILEGLKKANYSQPTPIQEQSIPAVLAGRDLLGCAQTGTGKTAAFSVPIIQLLSEGSQARQGNSVHKKAKSTRAIRSLILSPTRELAIQISDNIKVYSRYTDIRSTAIVGGVSQRVQERALQQGADIVIATPGRLMDLVNQKQIDLSMVEILVLDEADRMLDMGFIHDVKRIIAKMPNKKQTLFFSATMPPEIVKMVQTLLVNPVKVEITPVSSTVDRIQQSVYLLEKGKKQSMLNLILQDQTIASALVFTRTKRGADRVTRDLAKVNVTAQAIHGNKSQNERQRALNNFKSGVTRVLVATDIAARGIDVEELTHVINFNLPNIPETYVHRIGRTGRAGKSGMAISFCEQDELAFLKDIEKVIKKSIPVVKDHPYPMNNMPVFAQMHPTKQTSKTPGGKSGSHRSAADRPGKSKTNPARKPKSEWFTKRDKAASGGKSAERHASGSRSARSELSHAKGGPTSGATRKAEHSKTNSRSSVQGQQRRAKTHSNQAN
ncbi:DEAD/DEAH box helicase [Paenibacillus barcinonensis]|uniref:ATP-dependent RNA helicase CshA n=1 Tax=Paenibacillus barcinonensis TaxID=198119 RepID=A0A2V4VU76_PAEBA|nr:DEAD/DEAH box helicase [Paenibacillus barcinonensis]PYE50360.1 ATP-dependent RNA helicase RhlE [Paenibacillus barcinonensis]QKS55034.1 DEAD/DEAH box helicase [Paenibacillus barcinonensis]